MAVEYAINDNSIIELKEIGFYEGINKVSRGFGVWLPLQIFIKNLQGAEHDSENQINRHF